jgi:hypothetical protein
MNITGLIKWYHDSPHLLDLKGKYKTNEGEVQEIITHILHLLKFIVMWSAHWMSDNHPYKIPKNTLIKLTKQDLNIWRIKHIVNTKEVASPPKTPTTSEPVYKELRKETNREATAYEIFKEESHYDS